MGSSMRHRSKFAELLATRKQKQAEQAGSLTRRWFVTEDLWMAGTAAVAEAQAEQVIEPPLLGCRPSRRPAWLRGLQHVRWQRLSGGGVVKVP